MTLADSSVIPRAIVADDNVVGNIGGWTADGERMIGYWIARKYWGRGHATHAVGAFLTEVPERPLCARVSEHSIGSLRVLAKCGFAVGRAEHHLGDRVNEIVLRPSA